MYTQSLTNINHRIAFIYVAHMELKSLASHNAHKMLVVFLRWFVLYYFVAIHIKPSLSKNGYQ